MQTLLPQEHEKGITVISFGRPTYEQAKDIIRGQVKNMDEYLAFRKKNPSYSLPSNPRSYYKDIYVSNFDFFGTIPTTPRHKAIQDHWNKVKSGEVVRKPYTKKVKPTIVENEPSIIKVAEQQVEDDRILLVNIMRKYGILDLCKSGIRTLFTYDELLEIVIK
jgi:hypothetical protein